MIKKIYLLFNTLRFLKPIQFYWRVYLKLIRIVPFSFAIKTKIIVRQLELTPSIVKHTCLIDNQFRFLNQPGSAGLPVDWNADQASKLWLYNLHYFDYLNQEQIDKEAALGLIHDWINQNQVGMGNGWEPYTLSLRIVNWIKFLPQSINQNEKVNQVYESLFVQARYLSKHLEYHLLGNHLFKNGVALMFAGVYFEGKEAQRWLTKGLQIISQQTREQVLEDGGHFERSPMYHVLILEDVLDCLNLDQSLTCFSPAEAEFMKHKAADMLGFLADIVHQDGEIPFFNDCALQIVPSPESVFKYADSIGIQYVNSNADSKDLGGLSYIEKSDFGLYVFQSQLSKLIFDAGLIGPDYLPGHAHCDTLSYELSIAGKRCIVNSGTYQYAGEQRNFFRATSAHNTLKIDGAEQHEIWSTFRVARRGYPFNVSVDKQNADLIECSASYSGFKRLAAKSVHKRIVRFQKDQVIIKDVIEGIGKHLAESYIHLHPEVEIINYSDNILECKRDNSLFSVRALDDLKIDIEKAWFSLEFGIKRENTVLVLRKQAVSPFSFGYTICF